MDQLQLLKNDLHKLANSEKATFLQRFFKTGEGEYGFGDIFIGLTVPQSRSIALKYKDLAFEDIYTLLTSKIHEERLIALLILVHTFEKGNNEKRKEVFTFYLQNIQYINNWDLVDLSADKIVGEYLLEGTKETKGSKEPERNVRILQELANSGNIWERRIAMISTYAFIKKGYSKEALTIAAILIHDKHDLIQKAVGWMLREVGKRCSRDIEETFLKNHYKTMPRTALRYAIEHFPEERRKQYLNF